MRDLIHFVPKLTTTMTAQSAEIFLSRDGLERGAAMSVHVFLRPSRVSCCEKLEHPILSPSVEIEIKKEMRFDLLKNKENIC